MRGSRVRVSKDRGIPIRIVLDSFARVEVSGLKPMNPRKVCHFATPDIYSGSSFLVQLNYLDQGWGLNLRLNTQGGGWAVLTETMFLRRIDLEA